MSYPASSFTCSSCTPSRLAFFALVDSRGKRASCTRLDFLRVLLLSKLVSDEVEGTEGILQKDYFILQIGGNVSLHHLSSHISIYLL